MFLIQHLKTMWKAAPVATLLLALALAVSVGLGGRMVARAIYWSDPAHINQPLAGWMTPHYIAHSWHIPREVMITFLNQTDTETPPRPAPLSMIAQRRGIPLDQLIQDLNAKIAAYKVAHPTPGKAQ